MQLIIKNIPMTRNIERLVLKFIKVIITFFHWIVLDRILLAYVL
jgi:hypothetical protein